MKMPSLLIVIIAGLMAPASSQFEELPESQLKNTIHVNVTNPFIIHLKSWIFGYERVLSDRQSFSVNVGTTAFPGFSFLNTDSLESKSTLSDKGVNLSFDYRFYLANENKFAAPRGVYIGPYYSFNYFERENSWQLQSTQGGPVQGVNSTTSLTAHTIGAELGYQFILWKRISLDFVLAGPGIAFYDLKLSVGSNLSEEDKQKFFEGINAALAERFPGYNKVIDESEFRRQGSAKSTSLGFRYMLLIGYRF